MKPQIVRFIFTALLLELCPSSGTALLWAAGEPPPLPTVSVFDNDGNAAESGANSGSFTVTRTGSTDAALNVRYSLGGSAANGLDYATLSGSVEIPAGKSSATVRVNTIDDSTAEGDESVVLTLVSDAAYLIGLRNSATVEMEDNDNDAEPPTGPTVSVVDSDGNAAESGSNSGSFTVTRTGSTAAALSVRYSLGGSAANGLDYATLSDSVEIPAGSSSATILVNTIDDSIAEGDESVLLTLLPDVAYVIGSPNSATVDIEDNDGEPPPLPTVRVVDSDGNASESGPNSGSFTVTRTGSTATALNVRYSLGGSAANGLDYATLSGSVEILAGSSSATILVDTIDDSNAEGDESVTLTLVSDAAYVIGSPGSATVDMEDNDGEPPAPAARIVARGPIALESKPGTFIIALSWNGTVGKRYQLQYNSTCNTTNWVNLGNVLTATNASITASDVMRFEAQRFYRVVQLP